jgi:hypothetical protein
MSQIGDRLLGAWRLKAYDDRESIDHEWIATYGPEPLGLGIYDPSGWLSMQIAEADGSRFDAYFGRFTIVAVESEENGDIRGVLHHHVAASSMVEMLTADQSRPFRISGATLTLGDGLTWRRVFERAR